MGTGIEVPGRIQSVLHANRMQMFSELHKILLEAVQEIQNSTNGKTNHKNKKSR
jgi:hypothetical protein